MVMKVIDLHATDVDLHVINGSLQVYILVIGAVSVPDFPDDVHNKRYRSRFPNLEIRTWSLLTIFISLSLNGITGNSLESALCDVPRLGFFYGSLLRKVNPSCRGPGDMHQNGRSKG